MTELDLVLQWFAAFVTTAAVEVPIAALALRRASVAVPRGVGLAVLAQFATHPMLWFILPTVLTGRTVYVVVGEATVTAMEAALYALAAPALGFRRAALVSIVANGASVAAGELLRALGAPF
ncbi:MAG: hypothetical protein FJ104_16860 [Deltaproteobacteria bacterium]|nr:hypothetical protein [Deltaproteobacteria bacterium]